MTNSSLSNLHRLRTFVAVAEQGSFSRAARHLYLTQPTVSMQLKELESATGGPLFVRGQGKVQLTELGREVLEYAQRMLALAEEMENSIQARSGVLSGHVAVGGAHYVRIQRAVANLLINFRVQHPEVTFLVRFGATGMIADLVREERLALGVVSPRPRDSTLAGRIVRESEHDLRVIVPVGHPLAELEVVTLRDLERYPFIHHPRPQQAYVDEFLEGLGCHPHYAMEIESPEGIRDAVANGAGISLLPEYSLDGEPPGRLLHLPLAAPPMKAATHVIWARSRHLTLAERAVVERIAADLPRYVDAEAARLRGTK